MGNKRGEVIMPPKLINLFGERKFYIGRDEVDMKPLEEITKDAITIVEEAPIPEFINTTGDVSFTMKLKVNSEKIQKAIDQLLYTYGLFRKRRKTTYKTLRHDCAKRNGRR